MQDLKDMIVNGRELMFANVKIKAEALPLVFPHSFDGVTAINRFRENAVS